MSKRKSRVFTLRMQGVALQPVESLIGEDAKKDLDECCKTAEEPPPTTVWELMRMDLGTLPLGLRRKRHIIRELEKHSLSFGPDIVWKPHKVLTLRMQKVVRYPAIAIVDINVMERLEDALHGTSPDTQCELVAHLMRLDLDALSIPKDDRDHIVHTLGTYGLTCSADTIWLIQYPINLAQQKVQKADARKAFGDAVVDRVEIVTSNTIRTVGDVMKLSLKQSGVDEDDREHIVGVLKPFCLKCDPYNQYLPQRILTSRMEELIDCHIDEVGISFRISESLEKHAGVIVLKDLLAMDVNDLKRFTQPVAEGGVSNFGASSLQEIEDQLEEYGFTPHNSGWTKESHVESKIKEQFLEMIGKAKPDFL